jgi:hypothetical protein
MTRQCHGTKRKESSTNARSKVLQPGYLAKATRKLVVANETRRKKLGLPRPVEPTSPTIQKTSTVVQPARPAIPLPRPAVQPKELDVQPARPAIQPPRPAVQPTDLDVQPDPPAPVVLPSQVTAPASLPSLEEDDHLQGVQGENTHTEQEAPKKDAIIKTIIRPIGQGYFIFVSFTTYHVLIFIKIYLFYNYFFCCCRFTPSKDGANAMRMAIRRQFRDVFSCWEKVPQDLWFETFSVRI